MAKTATLNVRIDPEIKNMAEKLYSSFGITITDAINMFLHQSILVGGLPFDLKQPRYNATTEAAMQEARDIMTGKIQTKGYTSVKEMMEDLDDEC